MDGEQTVSPPPFQFRVSFPLFYQEEERGRKEEREGGRGKNPLRCIRTHTLLSQERRGGERATIGTAGHGIEKGKKKKPNQVRYGKLHAAK